MLLAQSASENTSYTWPVISILIGGALLFAFGLFFVLLFRHLRSSRQLLHTERMRSLEAGIPLEAPEETNLQAKFLHNAFWISFWMVFGVPSAALSAASAVTKEHNNLALLIVIWLAAAAISVAAVVCAAVLMIYSRSRTIEAGDGLRKMPKLM